MNKECKNITKSYAEVSKNSCSDGFYNNTNKLTTAIKKARKEEVIEENDRLRRSNNVIIHGVPEETLYRSDQKWVSQLIENLHILVRIKQVSRIGKKEIGKMRPMMVALKDENEKFKFIGSLSALRGLSEYIGISIKEDFTLKERITIKTLSKEAKEKNETEKLLGQVWRIRGTSKSGFYLKKVIKQDEYL